MNEQSPDKKQYSLTDIEQYLQGKLSPAAMHDLEKAALQDSFLADAIDGYGSTDLSAVKDDLAEIHAEFFRQKSTTTRLIPISRNKWWRVAAGIIFLSGTGLLGWYFNRYGSAKKETVQIQQHLPIQKTDTGTIKQAGIVTLNHTKEKKSIKKTVLAMPVAGVVKPDTTHTAMNYVSREPVDDNRLKSATQALDTVLAKEQITASAATGAVIRGKIPAKAAAVSRMNIQDSPPNDSKQLLIDSSGKPPDMLNEVVVIGYGSMRKKDLTITSELSKKVPGAEVIYTIVPVNGWNAMNEYLIKQLSLSKPDTATGKYGRVDARLTLDESGRVIKAKIITSFNKKLNKKISKALKEGPLWIKNGQNTKNDFIITIKL